MGKAATDALSMLSLHGHQIISLYKIEKGKIQEENFWKHRKDWRMLYHKMACAQGNACVGGGG
jgi:hypothetical protein